VMWAGRRVVVTLPDHIDVSNAGRVREELLSVLSRGAGELIADMSATASCDHAGAEAVALAFQRAVGNGVQLRLVVTTGVVHHVLSLNGIDRLIPIYPTLRAATAAGAQGEPRVSPPPPAPVP
jgi:anti-sigma B factor antagonist